MAYSTSNPPVLVTQGGIDGSKSSIWYLSGTDATTTVDGSGYITNGGDLGMAVGDLVMYHKTDSYTLSTFYVKTVSATAPGAVDLADATTVGSGTNTD